MQWHTTTQIPDFGFEINHKSTLLFLGSCFAENIGQRLKRNKFNLSINPTGIIYNPLSLQSAVETICSPREYVLDDLQHDSGLFFSYDHHSRFSATGAESALEKMNGTLDQVRENLSETQVVFISLGSAFYWWLKAENRVVNNCHKQPSNLFEQRRSSVTEIRSALTETVVALKHKNPEIKIVFTVSPVRHLKHGSQGNQLSKATLMVAAQELAEAVDGVYYFPSYELFLDDLRDYRWYEEDLIHPNKMAIDYIWEKFSSAFFKGETMGLIKEVEKIQNMLQHRVFEPNTERTLAFVNSLRKAIKESGVPFQQEFEQWQKANGL